MTSDDGAGETFEIPDFDEKKTPIFEEIPDSGIDDLEPLTPRVRQKELKIVEKPAIVQKPTLNVPEKYNEPATIDYNKVSEFGEYPAEKKPAPAPVPTRTVNSLPNVSEKPFITPPKKGLWARLVDKIPVDKDGKLNIKQDLKTTTETTVVKKPVIKIQVVPEKPVSDKVIDENLEAELSSFEKDVAEDNSIPVIETPVVKKQPVVSPPKPKPVISSPRMQIIEEPAQEPEPVVDQEIQKLLDRLKTPSPIVNKPGPVVEVQKSPPIPRIEVKKLIKDALTTRKTAPAVQTTAPGQSPAKRSFVERKFSPKPESEKKSKPQGSQPPKEDDSLFDNGEAVPDPVVEAIRNKPLPQVKMIPKETFWGRLKRTWIISKIIGVQKERKRRKETGLTPRQRIKRYNNIHECGYGKEEDNDKAAEAQ